MAEKRTRIGMLTPSSNTVLEPCVSAMLHDVPDVTAHFQRFTVKEISLDQCAEAQFSDRLLVEAAKLLNDARMDVIAWAGTAAGWRGFDVDSRLCSNITAATGAPATSSVLALNELLQRTGICRFGLVTPYIDEVQARIVANYTGAGYRVVGERHLGDRGNFSFSEYEGDTIAAMIREVAAGNDNERPEAIVILCTNFRGAPLVPMLESELGIPLYDSISVTVWKALTMTGQSPRRLAGWGRLFAEVD